MGIFDPAAESEALGDRDGCWTFIRSFAAAWREPLAPDDGESPADIAAVEQRLLVPLPAAVHEAYALFGRRDDLSRNEHRMRRLDRLDFWSPHGPHMLVFRVAGQGSFHWGIRLADLHLDDPPVMVRTDRRGWFRYLDRFSLAAVELVLYETVVGEGMYLAMGDYDDALAARLTGQYATLELPPVPVDEDDPAGRVHWYGAGMCSFPCKAMPPCGSADAPSRISPKPSGPCPASGTTPSEATHPLRPLPVPVNLARGRLGRLRAVWAVAGQSSADQG